MIRRALLEDWSWITEILIWAFTVHRCLMGTNSTKARLSMITGGLSPRKILCLVSVSNRRRMILAQSFINTTWRGPSGSNMVLPTCREGKETTRSTIFGPSWPTRACPTKAAFETFKARRQRFLLWVLICSRRDGFVNNLNHIITQPEVLRQNSTNWGTRCRVTRFTIRLWKCVRISDIRKKKT